MLHVNGGTGDTSYARNSLLQQKVISVAWPIAKEAITELYSRSFPGALTMADLGCSTGSNTLRVVSNLIIQVEDIRRKLHRDPLPYQIFFNDLHGNDFNAIFRSLPTFLANLETQIGATHFGPCFFNGLPGSFYARLFPDKTVHFFHSSNSLHWLSQVPEGIENNKGNIYIGTTSPKSVLQAYSTQFQKDFSMFLKYRADELVLGGRMVLTLLGRTTEDPSNKESTYFWELLASALNSMVVEGIVEEKKADSFNLPWYMPSEKELEVEMLKEGSFTLNEFQVSRFEYLDINYNTKSSPSTMGIDEDNEYDFAKCVQSVVEPLFVRHFEEDIIEDLFSRYKKLVVERMSKENIECIIFTLSITKIK